MTGLGLWKDYRRLPAFGLDGLAVADAALRADRIWQAGATWTLPVPRDRTGRVDLDLVVDYWLTDHRSNDAFSNYRSQAVGAGVTLSY